MSFRPYSRASQYASWNRTRLETGYRSQLEVRLGEVLEDVPDALYEPMRIPYQINTSSHYTPDWILFRQAIILEAKGEFNTADRQKMQLIKQQYSSLDIRIILGSPGTRLTTQSNTTYAMWCEKNGFPWCKATKFPPDDWLEHEPTEASRNALDKLMKDVGYVLPQPA